MPIFFLGFEPKFGNPVHEVGSLIYNAQGNAFWLGYVFA